MIIEFSPTFASLDAAAWLPFVGAVKSCLYAHQQGWHIVAPTRDVATSLLRSGILSADEAQFIEFEVVSRLASLLGQAKTSAATLFCVTGPLDPALQEQRHCRVELSRLEDGLCVMPARLLVEDQFSDGAMYLKIAQLVGDSLGYFGPVKLEVVHGGGGGLERQYGNSFNDVRPLLCIVDSDRRHSQDGLGQTALAVARVGDRNDLGTVRMAILPTKEIENLVPLSFLYEVYANDGIVRRRIDCYQRFKNRVPLDMRREVLDFCDMKRGVLSDEWETYPEDIKSCFAELAMDCRTQARAEGEIVRLTETVVAMTLRLLEMTPRFEAKFKERLLRSPTFDHLRPILEVVLAFGASLGRVPVRLT